MTTERTENTTDRNCLVSGGQFPKTAKSALNTGARARIPHVGTRHYRPRSASGRPDADRGR